MTASARGKSIRIAPQQDQPGLSKGQKAFNSLVRKIETLRHELAQWQLTLDAYHEKVASEYAPLQKKFNERKAALVLGLDRAVDGPGLSKAERRVLQGIICELAQGLIAQTGDPAIKAVYNRHSETDFDTGEAAATDALKSAMEQAFGVDLGESDELKSREDVMEALKDRIDSEHLQAAGGEQRSRQAPKSARQQARDARQKLEADQTSLSIRQVYRKLASALHPDREPEAAERARKTALMQRVNQAYDKKNLLQLLELQLELEHIDETLIDGLSDDRLKHYNKILKEQVAELEQEIADLAAPLNAQFDLPRQTLAPGSVMPMLMRDIAELRRGLRQIKSDLLAMNELPKLKALIEAYRRM